MRLVLLVVALLVLSCSSAPAASASASYVRDVPFDASAVLVMAMVGFAILVLAVGLFSCVLTRKIPHHAR